MPAKFFSKKVIWITGASSGIGEACSYEFSQQKAHLILTALEAEVLENVKTKCLRLGAKSVHLLPYDLCQKEGLTNLASDALSCFGYLDLVFLNAGISQRGTVVETQLKVIEKVMDINFYSSVILTQAILPSMIARGNGQLAATTSIAGHFGFPLRSAYCASKHALYGFFETVQAENYQNGIRVTLVCPGRVQTNISINALEKDGKTHGILDEGQQGGIPVTKAAKKIVHALTHKKREVLVGGKELLMVYIKRFFPSLCGRIARNLKAT